MWGDTGDTHVRVSTLTALSRYVNVECETTLEAWSEKHISSQTNMGIKSS